MEHGTVVEGEESDEEVPSTTPEMQANALHDLSRPVHAVFTPSTMNAGTVCEGEEDSDDDEDEEGDGQPLPADDDTKEFRPSPVSEKAPPLTLPVKNSVEEEEQEDAENPPVR